MPALLAAIHDGRISAASARAMLAQGYTPAQIIRSCTVPAIA